MRIQFTQRVIKKLLFIYSFFRVDYARMVYLFAFDHCRFMLNAIISWFSINFTLLYNPKFFEIAFCEKNEICELDFRCFSVFFDLCSIVCLAGKKEIYMEW